MSKRSLFRLCLLSVPLAGFIVMTQLGAQSPEPKQQPPVPPAKAEAAATPVKPKPLSDSAKKGLTYIINQQHADGGWGQGGGWRQGEKGGGRVEGANVEDPSDLGNTCIAVLALIRAGSTPKDGDHAKNIAKAVDFIMSRIENSDNDSLYVTDVRNTQLQIKIGPYVDTFLAQLVMAELKGKMPEAKTEKRLLTAFDKTMAKIAKHQKADGNFDQNVAWASTLSMALCSKGINRASQMGFDVPQRVLAADQKANTSGLDMKTGTYSAPAAVATSGPATSSLGERLGGGAGAGRAVGGAMPASDAGVQVYGQAGKASGLQEAVNTLKKDEAKNREIKESPTAPKADKERAETELKRLDEAQIGQKAAVDGLIRRLDDKQFIQGFGSNGGEEFLSYMNISETLVVQGGKDWLAWDKSISESLERVQDKDGGWSGQHCITGRTFCTSTALLTMLADRAPIPVVKKDVKKDEKK